MKTFRVSVAWLLIVLIPLVLWSLFSRWAGQRPPRAMAFNSTVSSLDFIVDPAQGVWTAAMPRVAAIEIGGCAVHLGDGRSTVAPRTGGLLLLTAQGTPTLQVMRHAGTVRASTEPGASGIGISWGFAGAASVEVVLLAEALVLNVTSELEWYPPESRPEQQSLPLPGQVQLTCAPPGRHLAFVVDENQRTHDVTVRLDVEQASLSAPRGTLTIGNQITALGGAGRLLMSGDFTLESLRWSPGGNGSLAPAISGISSDVRLCDHTSVSCDHQLMPSILSDLASAPQWTAIVAVLVVALGALYGKLFDLALPSQRE